MKNRMIALAAIITLAALVMTLGLGCSKGSVASSPQDFYKGKTVRYIVSSEPGGGTDLIARAIAPVLSKEIGATVKVENMGTDEGPNYLYTQGPKDGLVMVSKSTDAMVGNDILKAAGTQYEADKFNYLADVSPSNKVMQVSPKLPYKTLEELQKAKGLKGGGTSAKGAIATSSSVASEILGLDAKVITGYNGKKELTLAIARGEIDFMVTNDDSAMKDEQDGFVKNFLAIGEQRSAIATHAPTIFELGVKVPKELEAAHKYIAAGGTSVFLPPGTPQDRVDYLRAAFMKISESPDLQNEVKKFNNGVWRSFVPGKTLQDDISTIKSNKDLVNQLDTIFNKHKAVN